MKPAIGVVMTEHIVAGRLEEQKLVGTLLRFPDGSEAQEDLAAMPKAHWWKRSPR